MMILLTTALGVACGFTLPDIPDMPDLVESVQSVLKWNFTEERVEEPKTFLPSIAEINAMSDEEKTDRFHWFFSVFVMVYVCFVFLGSGIMIGGAELKARGDYQALGRPVPLSKEAQILLVMLSLLVTVSLSFTASIWSLQTGRLSKKLGLDWEVYLFLFCCGCLSLLIQSVVAVAWLKAGDRFDATAFAVASMSVLPVVSDQFDTLKDIIFGALCVQSEHWAMKVLGVLSWLYLLAFHAWFIFCGVVVGLYGENAEGVPGANCFSELATSHLAVLLTAPKVDGESSAGFWEGTILPTLYKQLTPSKRQYLMTENLPQAVLSLLFLFFEGGSMFIIVLNLALPAVQIFLASLLFNPVRAAAAPALGKALSRAVHTGNLIAAKTIWLEAEVGKDLEFFQRMLPHLRFLLDVMARSGFKELNKLSEGELVASQGIAEMLASGEAHCLLQFRELGNSGAKVVAEAMKHTAMEELNLDDNEIGAEGAEALGEGLKENNSLQQLHLAKNNIGAPGAQALGEGLKENNSLQRLDLENNSMGDAGAKALGEGLKENNSLQRLDLDKNSIGAAGAEALGEGLKENNSLLDLYLYNNSIGDAGAEALGEGLKENNSLQRLDLDKNSIGAAGAEALAEGLKENNSLQRLSLDKNNIGDAGAKALAAGIIENRSLTLLGLSLSLRNTPGGQALEEAEEVKKARGEDFEIVWW